MPLSRQILTSLSRRIRAASSPVLERRRLDTPGIAGQVRRMIPEPGPDSRRVSFFDEQATHRARARRWGAVSALIILVLGGVYGFLMLGVLSFYALLLAGLLPTWLTAPLAAAGLKDSAIDRNPDQLCSCSPADRDEMGSTAPPS
jgi:hypothetical protein